MNDDACLRLWASVVRLAVDDFISNRQRDRDTAVAWFASDRMGMGSFLWCCDQLNLDCVAVREKLRAGEINRQRYGERLACRSE